MYDIEGLYEAHSLEEALSLLNEHGDAVIIAGGSDVLIKIREGKLAGAALVSLQKLDELRHITLADNGDLHIGSLMSFSHITRNPLIQQHIPVLGQAVDMVGGPQIRNIGTIGGNICNGVSSADSASTLLAYDAVLEYTSLVDGKLSVRNVPITEHYVSAGKTSLKHNEILRDIIIPKDSYTNTPGNYIKYAMRNAMDIATIGCSANLRLSPDGKTIERARLAYGVAAPVPVRAFGAEAFAQGKNADEAAIARIAEKALDDIKPRDSWRASADLRKHLAVELARRAFTVCLNLTAKNAKTAKGANT
jgi:xanthine dehydrogenase FAD-binding subunit